MTKAVPKSKLTKTSKAHPKKKASIKRTAVVEAVATVPRAKVPSVWQLTKQPSLLLWRHWRLFTGITLVYSLLTVILAQSLAGTSATTLKTQLSQAAGGHLSGLASSALVFTGLIGSAGSKASGAAGANQFFLSLIASLAIIWALRQTVAGQTLRIRDAYYKGVYPLVPFVLVLLVIGLQLLPMVVGSSVYAIVISQGIAVHVYEKIIWASIFGLLTLLTLYWLASSLFGLYIVTLPDMTPLKALRSARQLVRGRRWTVLRKLLFLPLLLLLVAAVVMLPFIIWLTPLATYVFFLLGSFALLAVHSYMYGLYRDLLNE